MNDDPGRPQFIEPEAVPASTVAEGATPQGSEARPSYFSKVELAPPDRPRRLDLTHVQGSPPLPKTMAKLIGDIQAAVRLVVILFEHDDVRRMDFLGQLHLTADTGLRGPNASVENGLLNLDEVKQNIASDFDVVRTFFYWRYFLWLLCVGIPLFLGGGVIYVCAMVRAGGEHFPSVLEQSLSWLPRIQDVSQGYPAWVILPLAATWIPAGALLGIFLEFMLRVDGEIEYDKLASINPGRWKVGQRLINTIVVGYCFAAIMAASVFQVGIVTYLLNDFSTTKPWLSPLVGFVTGFSFSYVRDILYRVRPEVRTS